MTAELVSWHVIGRHRAVAAGPTGIGEVFDGVDLALALSDGTTRGFGVRTPELFLVGAPERDLGWDDGYVPIATDLDPATVEYWSFDRVLWLGPEPRPCVIWINALALAQAGLERLLSGDRVALLLRGRDGAGLPLLAEVASIADPVRPGTRSIGDRGP